MNFSPTPQEMIARARADLRMGAAIVLVDSAGQGSLVMAAETMQESRWKLLQGAQHSPVLAITRWRASTLKARAYDGDLARVRIPSDVNLAWVRAISDPADDLITPMKGPLISEREGSATTHRVALTLCKAARLLPAALVMPVENPLEMARSQWLTLLRLDQVLPHLNDRSPLENIVHARLPLTVSEAGRLHVFRPEDGGEEHYAVEIGKPLRGAPVLCRLHSACFTGDLLGSLKCDCGPQLRGALAQMGEEQAGILLYLNQEGRGIGLANKMRAYALQDQGFDTVDANHRLGFEDDERDFRLGSDILRALGFSAVRLLTNNPAKVSMMEASGIEVAERVPLRVGETLQNKGYLATKAAKSGHLL